MVHIHRYCLRRSLFTWGGGVVFVYLGRGCCICLPEEGVLYLFTWGGGVVFVYLGRGFCIYLPEEGCRICLPGERMLY